MRTSFPTEALNAGGVWPHDRYVIGAAHARNWRLATFFVLGVLGVETAGLVYITTRQQVRIEVVRVDDNGTVSVGSTTRPDDPTIVAAWLRRWLEDVRTVSGDMGANRARINTAYGACLAAAQQFLSAEFTEQSPEELLRKGRRFPVKIAVFPVAGSKTWRARWTEQTVNEGGAVVAEQGWAGEVQVESVTPQTREERERSPLGLWIASIQWAEQ
jgi:type IV secretory pathway TrbF-like protein